MIVQSLKEHFPARFIEWFMAGVMITWGMYVLASPEMFTHHVERDLFEYMARLVLPISDEAHLVWGFGTLVAGLIRAVALFVNGAYVRTPIIRVVTSFMSAFVWTQILLCLIYSGISNPSIAVYSWLIVADLVSAYRASKDAVFAESQRRQDNTKGANRAAGLASFA